MPIQMRNLALRNADAEAKARLDAEELGFYPGSDFRATGMSAQSRAPMQAGAFPAEADLPYQRQLTGEELAVSQPQNNHSTRTQAADTMSQAMMRSEHLNTNRQGEQLQTMARGAEALAMEVAPASSAQKVGDQVRAMDVGVPFRDTTSDMALQQEAATNYLYSHMWNGMGPDQRRLVAGAVQQEMPLLKAMAQGGE